MTRMSLLLLERKIDALVARPASEPGPVSGAVTHLRRRRRRRLVSRAA